MNFSKFMENGFLQSLRGIAFGAPAQVYARLFITSPGESGTEGTEVAYDGYQGMPIVFAPPVPESGGIGIRNSQTVTFPRSPINAGTVRWLGIYDTPTGGNMYLFGQLAEDLPIVQGEEPVLRLNETLFFSTGNLANAYKVRLFNVVRGTSLPGTETFHALFSGIPDAGGIELSGLNYARVSLTFSAPIVDEAGASVIKNDTAASYNVPSTNWGTWSHSAIMSAAAGGEVIWQRARDAAKVINRGIMPKIDPGAISLGVN